MCVPHGVSVCGAGLLGRGALNQGEGAHHVRKGSMDSSAVVKGGDFMFAKPEVSGSLV
jgi:hypothetical protein